MQEYHGTFDEFVDRPGEINWVGGDAPRFKLMPFDELTPGTARRFLIKNILPRRGLILIWGAPKCGKSFWTFDAVMHVALGWEYRGLRVHQGPVVYCAFEGAEGFKARAEAFRQQHGLMGQRPPFYLTEAAMDLVQDQPALVASIKAQIGKVMPAVVVLDTLNRSLRGSESSDEDMANYVRAADAVQQAIECAVIVVHHCGHDGNRPRGHSALLGAVDAQIAISRDGVANIVATVERMKDGPEGATIASRLDQVTVGTDEDGDPITSCVTVEAEQAAAQERGPRLTANQKTMFSIVVSAGAQGISTEKWNELARDAGIGIKRKADLYDIREALQRKGFIYQGVNGWCAKPN
jgi:hypothetical protein